MPCDRVGVGLATRPYMAYLFAPLLFAVALSIRHNLESSMKASLEQPQLIEHIRQGDEKAFEQLFNMYSNQLFRFLWHLVRSQQAAEDLTQDIFLKIWKTRATWQPTGPVAAYLFRAAKNTALNYLRDNRPDRFEEVGEQHVGPEAPADLVEENETRAIIQRCIDRLPAGCRTVFIMSRYQNARYKEIAATLQISVKTVEHQMGRALRLLRKCLRPSLDRTNLDSF